MSEHLSKILIEQYLASTIAPSELLAMDAHLEACSDCRRSLAEAADKSRVLSLREDLATVEATEHLDDARLAAYADGTLSEVDAEIATSHLSVCSRCELLASDLVMFKDEIAGNVEREYAPPGKTAIKTAVKVASTSWREKLSGFAGSIFGFDSPALTIGAGALALLVIGVFVWLAMRTGPLPTSEPEVVRTSSPTPSASPQITTSPSAEPSPSPEILLALSDGSRQFGIDRDGNLTGAEDLPPGVREMVKTALTTQDVINSNALAGVTGRPSELRGAPSPDAKFAPITPVGKVVWSIKPTLQWTSLSVASEYKITIYDQNFNPVAVSPPLQENSWVVDPALKRGEIYTWQIAATKNGSEIKTPVAPAGEAKFKILDAKATGEITMARKNFSESRLAMGVLYARAGLLDEAEHEFYMLSVANPKSEIAKKLLRTVRAAKRRGG